MKYNFNVPVDRHGTDSLKWDVGTDELPMWVADMDFETAPEIKEALIKRAEHGVFGYTEVPDRWYDAYIDWWKKRHSFEMEKSWLIFSTGVVPTISSTVRKLTTPAEKVLIQTPVYGVFFNSVINNGRQVLENPLKYDGSKYEIDFDDLEEKLSDPQTSLMILCNPHNPVGKIWNRDTLAKVGELCVKHNVTVLSDEIHCDITDPDCEYIPFASVSEECRKNSVTCLAPTKAFNLAGLQTSAVVVPDTRLRHKIWRQLNTDEVAEPNAFAAEAAIAAFTSGGQWLDELREYIFSNKKLVGEYLEKEISSVKLLPSQATYLLWLDCSGVKGFENSDVLSKFIRKETGLYLSSGKQFGGNGNSFLRMNIACPESLLLDGLDRLKRGIAAYEK